MMTIRNIVAITCAIGISFFWFQPASAGFQISNSPQAEPTDIVSQAPVEQTKPLQIFSERYVPDSVRTKYNLQDDWFDKNNSVGQPVPLKQDGLQITSSPAQIVSTWRARKGEVLRSVLQRWSQRQHTDLMWASPESPVLQKDFSFVGKYQDAIHKLISTEGGNKIHSQYRSEGMDPVMMTPASTVTTTPPPVPNTKENALAQIFKPQQKDTSKPETRWFGLSGSPLAEVMQVWADDAGVRLVWQSEKNFALKQSVSQIGHFEDAVFRALSQYDNEHIRPVGEMYQDPANGQQVLLVRTETN